MQRGGAKIDWCFRHLLFFGWSKYKFQFFKQRQTFGIPISATAADRAKCMKAADGTAERDKHLITNEMTNMTKLVVIVGWIDLFVS